MQPLPVTCGSSRVSPFARAPCRRRTTYRRSMQPTKAYAGDQTGDEEAPVIFGDWRAFRAKLFAGEGRGRGWAARQSEANMQLLQMQCPSLAHEETWAHPTALPEAGGLLLATPDAGKILGDEYWQAVVFIVQHDEAGTLGLLLNRPTGLSMGRGRGGLPLPITDGESLHDAFAVSRLYCGGFRAQQSITLLHGHRWLQGCVEVVPGIAIGGQAAAVAEVSTGGLQQNDFRFFAGCLAWGPGELQQEIAKGAWYTAACSRTLVLKQCLQLPVPLWQEVMRLMGDEYADVALRAADGSESD